MPVSRANAEVARLKTLLSIDYLDSIKVRCPHCFQRGFIVSVWTRGVNPKSWYVVHRKGNEVNWCRLNVNERSQLQNRRFINKRILKKLIRQMRPFVLFSGGQDSLCAMLYTKEVAEELGKEITALFVDTTVSLPEVIQHAKEVCRILNVKLEVLKPETDFYTLARRKGIPRIKSRWCCEFLKIRPLKEYLEKVQEPKFILDGIRKEESKARKNYLPLWYHPTFKCISVSPIFYWTQQRVHAYLSKWCLPPSPCSSLGFSAECWCGAYSKRSDFEKLFKLHPDIYSKLEEVENARNFSFIYDYKNKRPVFLTEIRNMIHDIDV